MIPRLVNPRTHRVHYKELYNTLPNANSRPKEWLTRALENVSKGSNELFAEYSCFDSYDYSDLSELSFSCFEALLLLTFHHRSALYSGIIRQTEEESGSNLPVIIGHSRFEDSFAIKLDEVLSEIFPKKSHYKLSHKRRLVLILLIFK